MDPPHTSLYRSYPSHGLSSSDRQKPPLSWGAYPIRHCKRSYHDSTSGSTPVGYPTSAKPVRHRRSLPWGRYDPTSHSQTAVCPGHHGTDLLASRSRPHRWPCHSTIWSVHRYTSRTCHHARWSDWPRHGRQPMRSSPVPRVSHGPASSPYPGWNTHATPASRRSRRHPHHGRYIHTWFRCVP